MNKEFQEHKELYGFNEHIDERVLQEVGVYDEDKLLHTWVNDIDFLEYNIEYMKEQYDKLSQPIFNFAVTISCHMPYEMSLKEDDEDDPAKNLFIEKDRFFPYGYEELSEEMIRYIEHVSYTDYAIGKAFEKLEETGLLEDTVVIMYGDHGGGIDCDEIIERTDILSNDINNQVIFGDMDTVNRRMLLEVPFIIYDGSESVEFSEEPISLVRSHQSVARTIANLFDLDNQYSFGVDMLSSEKTYCYNPRNIDVNIHPTKTEIRFLDDKLIYAILHAATKKSIGQFSLSNELDFTVKPLDIPPVSVSPSIPKAPIVASVIKKFSSKICLL